MMIIKSSIGKSIIKKLLTISVFNKNYSVLNWDNSFVIRRTKPVVELVKTEITDENILTLKFKYHSSHSVMAEYIAEIEQHLIDKKQLLLNIWTNEQRENLIKKSVLNLTEESNLKVAELLNTKVFNEKYGENYIYFIYLYLNPDIVNAKSDERQFSEVTLKYKLKIENSKSEMRHKTKFQITKEEATRLCSAISYWKK